MAGPRRHSASDKPTSMRDAAYKSATITHQSDISDRLSCTDQDQGSCANETGSVSYVIRNVRLGRAVDNKGMPPHLFDEPSIADCIRERAFMSTMCLWSASKKQSERAQGLRATATGFGDSISLDRLGIWQQPCRIPLAVHAYIHTSHQSQPRALSVSTL